MSTDSQIFYENRRIWIIGATSGIGKALAVELAIKGAEVIASGRNSAKLDALVRAVNGHIEALPIDVAEEGAIASAIEMMNQSENLPDSIIYMAGFYEPGAVENISKEHFEQTLRVNLWAPIELVRLVAPIFYKRGSGQIALAASVAGYGGLPNGQPYSATKAALINLAESLYLEAAPKGVDIKLINPGFVATPMTDKNEFPMPNIISTEDAAKEIAIGLQRRNFEIHFPKRFTSKLKLLQLLPYRLYFKIVGRI